MSEWLLSYRDYRPEEEGHREALCTVGNGYFATRGAAPESVADGIHYPGTYVAGLYNRLTSEVAGETIENESMANVPNWLPLTFRVGDGPWFDVDAVEILEYVQEFDVLRGLLTRRVRFRDGSGRTTRLAQRRFAHMRKPHLAGLETVLLAEDWSGRITVRSGIDGRVTNAGVERYRALASEHLEPVGEGEADAETVWLAVRTTQSQLRVAEAARVRVWRDGEQDVVERRLVREGAYVAHEFDLELESRRSVSVQKVASIYTSRDLAVSEPVLDAREAVRRAGGFEGLLRSHSLAWDHLWRRFQIRGHEREEDQRILNVHVAHLLQVVSENSIGLDVGVPARGLHGEAYRGHVFWDELFIFPFLNYRLPELTRSLLRYRYRRLPEARWAAEEAGFEGAMFPWQSGSNGREENQRIHLNPRSGRWLPDHTHLQRHINIAVAYNVWQYYQITGDLEFLSFFGAEMLVEIARFWGSAASYDKVGDRYEICGVMGPDEYHDAYPGAEQPGLHNNAYTNVMVAWVLCRALQMLERLPEPQRSVVIERLRLRREELELWDDMSRKMRVVFHEDGIISQFEGYEDLEEFDWEGYREKYGDIHRLDRILEAEDDTTNRYKVSKQADVLMLFYLLSSDELCQLFERLGYSLPRRDIPRNVEYYLQRTSHGSTLSGVVHAWVLARTDRRRSWDFFQRAMMSDVADVQGGTTAEGIHLGAMAGSVDILQRGYTGLEPREDVLWVDPVLPKELVRLRTRIRYRGQWLDLDIDHRRVAVSAVGGTGEAVRVGIGGEVVEVAPGKSAEVPAKA
ncbi:MAG: glycoside hydrolase family 65 protein [Coriobacteriia bacterium]|nr:glycoside hydrolase family 65 protein [Coriobacteriia bacterium]